MTSGYDSFIPARKKSQNIETMLAQGKIETVGQGSPLLLLNREAAAVGWKGGS